jgi:hypothetical protein
MVLSDDTMTAAQHALQHGWIEEGALAAIRDDAAAENNEGPAPESETSPPETIVVDRQDTR